MKRGRKPKLDPPTDWKVRIPSSLRMEVEARLPRNVKGKIPLSAKGDLTAMLLRQWLTTPPPEAPVDLSDFLDN